MKGKIGKRIISELLIVFFAIAIFSTCISRYLFEESMPVVETAVTEAMTLRQVEEYSAKLVRSDVGNILSWEIIGTSRELEVGDTVMVRTVQYQDIKNGYRKLEAGYKTIDEYAAVITATGFSTRNDSSGNEERVYTFEVEAQGKLSDTYAYFVSVEYDTLEREYVLPNDCFIGNPSDYSSNLTIMVVKEKLMPWGYSNYVQEVSVNALERNEEYVAVSYYPGDSIVRNAEALGLKDGDWIRLSNS